MNKDPGSTSTRYIFQFLHTVILNSCQPVSLLIIHEISIMDVIVCPLAIAKCQNIFSTLIYTLGQTKPKLHFVSSKKKKTIFFCVLFEPLESQLCCILFKQTALLIFVWSNAKQSQRSSLFHHSLAWLFDGKALTLLFSFAIFFWFKSSGVFACMHD